MGADKFCLKWNDFESNISVAFKELKDDKDFFDVTLACDEEQLQAHKVILSACSPFFRNILRRNPHQHPLVYLKGVKYTDLQSVINFMYHGEVNVAQEELNSFLAVAEELRVKGLTQHNPTSSSEQPKREAPARPRSPPPSLKPPTHRPPDPSSPPPPKRPRPPPSLPQQTQEDDDEIQEVVPIKSEPRDTNNPAMSQVAGGQTEEHSLAPYQEEEVGYEEDYYEQEGDQYSQGVVDMQQHTMQAADGKGVPTPESLSQYVVSDQNIKEYHCALCDVFKAKLPSKVKNHLEAIHFPGLFLYSCELCKKTFKGRNALNIHKSTVHSKKAKLFNYNPMI